MYRLEWNDSKGRHELKGSAEDVKRELLPFLEPIDLGQLEAWMATAGLGESHGEIEDGYGWIVIMVG
jgi:hypothetical protein